LSGFHYVIQLSNSKVPAGTQFGALDACSVPLDAAREAVDASRPYVTSLAIDCATATWRRRTLCPEAPKSGGMLLDVPESSFGAGKEDRPAAPKAPGLPRLALDGALEAAKLPVKVGANITILALDAVSKSLRRP
jgi:hypothetical protein